MMHDTNITGQEMWNFAVKLFETCRHVEAIPIIFTAALRLERDTEGEETSDRATVQLESMKRYVNALLSTSRKTISNDVTMTEVVKKHAISLMLEIIERMKHVTSVDKGKRCELVVQAIRKFANPEELFGDDDAAKKTERLH